MERNERRARVPRRVFGRNWKQITMVKTKGVLNYYGMGTGDNVPKAQLLRLLAKLERNLGDVERAAIEIWLVDRKRNAANLTVLLNDIRGIPQPHPLKLVVGPVFMAVAECIVCFENLDLETFPQQKLTESCTHKPRVCGDCLTRSINAQIEQVSWDEVGCPECRQVFSHEVVKQWASPEAFTRYDQNALMSAFRTMPDFRNCLGPGCNSGQIHEGGDDEPIMTCTQCSFRTCFSHQVAWHAGQTCSEYDKVVEQKNKKEEEELSIALIAGTTKKCPNPECGHGIEKKGGCDQMKCRVCKHEFCYECLAPYIFIRREGNNAHRLSCKHHNNNIRW